MCKLILLSLFLVVVFSMVAAFAVQPTPDPSLDMTVTAVVLTNSYVFEALSRTQTAVAQTAAAPTDEPGFIANCQWNWNTQPRRDLSEQIQNAYDEQGMTTVTAGASYFGEDCLDPTTREFIRFGAMQTDYYISIQVSDLNDPAAIQNQMIDILTVLRPFFTSDANIVQPGDITFSFRLPDGTPALIMTLDAQVVMTAFAHGDLSNILHDTLLR